MKPGEPEAEPGEDSVSAQRAELDRVVRPLLSGVRGAALLDFPNHANVGDSAIWLGERALLRSLGCPVRYCADLESFQPEACRASVEDAGVILLHGGGNLGDLWAPHQEFRERVVRSFPDIPIIQLPQTIHFAGEKALDQARRALNAHPRLTLLVRDRVSLRVAQANFAAEARLCPDPAVALGRLPLPAGPRVPVVWNSRTDLEHPGSRPSPGQGQALSLPLPVDWLEEPVTPAMRVERRLRPGIRSLSSPPAWLSRSWATLLDRLARTRLERGCRMLAEGRAVVTNRLHGHLLCLLMGIPHYLSDNSYGKLRSYFESWTASSPLANWCDSEAEALELATKNAGS